MMKFIFPYKLNLHILQLEEYRVEALFKWVFKNFFKRKLEGKKPLVMTQKAKLLLYLSIFFTLFTFIILTVAFKTTGAIAGIILTTQPYIFLSLAILAIKPYEIRNRQKIKEKTREKVLALKKKGLKVIGITGSFGKTSVKEFLYQILVTKYSVLKTPESYNTLLGIAKVVDLELDESYEFFICEMGAYKIGEIKELCEIVPPDYGILTGINEQHLERFGSIENTIKAKFELVQAVNDGEKVLLNKENENVMNNYDKYVKNPNFYSSGSNLSAAKEMSKLLGMTEKEMEKPLAEIKPIPHRLEVKNLPDGTTLIDDAYNSNVDGFKQALNLLSTFKDQPKILVTPGIVELGNKTKEIHVELGKLADGICDQIFLVGKSERTEALAEGINNPKKTTYLDSISQLKDSLATLNLKSPVVLFENDLPDNY